VTPTSGASSVSFTVTGNGKNIGVSRNGTPVNTYDFGLQTTHVTSSAVTFAIVNEGSTDVSLDTTSIVITGPDASLFSVGTPPPLTVPAQSSNTTFTLTFAPTDYETARTATVSVNAPGAAPLCSFNISGLGTSGQIELRDGTNAPITGVIASGSTVTFDPVYLPGTQETFYIHNVASAGTLTLINFTSSSITDTVDFGLAAPLGSTVAPGGTQQFTISAGNGSTPDGTYHATVSFQTSDAANATFTFYLTLVFHHSLPRPP
jgi:hypothetical protein